MVVEKDSKKAYGLYSLRVRKAANSLFTKKQMEIINKILALEKLNRIESEAYSRTIKPRINAIIDFYDIAIIARNKE